MAAMNAPTKRRLDELVCVYPNAAGLDIGSAEIVVAVPPDRDPQPVRVFATFTPDLHALAAWLLTCGIDTVVLESTGVFWIPIYELLSLVWYPALSRECASCQNRSWSQERLE